MKYAIIGLLVLAVVVSGCVSNTTGQATQGDVKEPSKQPTSSLMETELMNILGQASVNQLEHEKDLEICKNLDKFKLEEKLNCFSNVAIKYKNPSFCIDKDDLLQGASALPCYVTVAGSLKDISICESVDFRKTCKMWRDDLCESGKDDCFAEVAKAKKDPAICAKVSNLDSRKLCYLSLGKEKGLIP